MRTYRITVEQLVTDEDLSKSDDRIDNPAGEYDRAAESEEHALDQFHHSVPIACLDDFEITAKLLLTPERLAARARYPIAEWRYEVANEDTLRGYEDWLDSKIEQEIEA